MSTVAKMIRWPRQFGNGMVKSVGSSIYSDVMLVNGGGGSSVIEISPMVGTLSEGAQSSLRQLE